MGGGVGTAERGTAGVGGTGVSTGEVVGPAGVIAGGGGVCSAASASLPERGFGEMRNVLVNGFVAWEGATLDGRMTSIAGDEPSGALVPMRSVLGGGGSLRCRVA
jgi:hypothetical protein